MTTYSTTLTANLYPHYKYLIILFNEPRKMTDKKKSKAADIATKAGVSMSTVDRVLNDRGRVSTKSIKLVKNAQSELAKEEIISIKNIGSIEVILPEWAGNSTRYLAAFLQLEGKTKGVTVCINWVSKMDPRALSDALIEASQRNPRGIAFQALDHPLVHEAVSKLRSEGMLLTTIVSDLTGHGELSFIGIDNRAAGRTAALLMGNYCSGSVAVVWSGQLSRAHEERESGFRALMRTEFPGIRVTDVSSGDDKPAENFRLIKKLLEDDETITGIYGVGAGPTAIVDAIKAAKRKSPVKVIAHNLTHVTREHLLSSEIDVIIHQDMHTIAKCAIERLLVGSVTGRRIVPTQIITRENILYHLDLRDIGEFLEQSVGNHNIP